MRDLDAELLAHQLAELRQEHRDLDDAISALMTASAVDQIQIQRLKKRKLVLKDKIRILEDGRLPNIIA